jgi:hypothetical protein
MRNGDSRNPERWRKDGHEEDLMTKLLRLLSIAGIVLIGFGIVAIGGALLYLVSLVFNPLLLLLIIPVWVLYSLVRRRVMRTYRLKRHGYFACLSNQDECKYEEYMMGEVVDLRIKLENTGPGEWDLFVPTESERRSTVPIWATDRRTEIIERIMPCLGRIHIHFPDDRGNRG